MAKGKIDKIDKKVKGKVKEEKSIDIKESSSDTNKNSGNWYYRLELSKKRALWGFVFLLPWLLGFFLFFASPLIETIMYSFSNVTISENGISKEFIDIANYKKAFTIDPYFNQYILTMLSQTLVQVLIVIIFSLLAAILLNGKYAGRSIARTIFFIPIIMGTSIASAHIVGNDSVSAEMSRGGGMSGFGSEMFIAILSNSGLPKEITGYVAGAVGEIFNVLATSGVPILIFLAGLQSISPALYEVAKIEGSSSYEAFWKVTLPMISPMVILCTVYSIIDAFAKHAIPVNNRSYPLLQRIRDIAFSNGNYGLASSMAVVYTLVTVIVIGIITFFMSRVVFYYD